MQVLVHTDHHIRGRENLIRDIEAQVTETLERFSDRVSRVELYVADENAQKAGSNDIRCTIEARVSGIAHLAVNEKTDQLETAVAGALGKLETALEREFGRLDSRRVRPGVGNLAGPAQETSLGTPDA